MRRDLLPDITICLIISLTNVILNEYITIRLGYVFAKSREAKTFIENRLERDNNLYYSGKSRLMRTIQEP